MKKAVIGIVLLAVVAAAGFYTYQTFFKKTLQIEDVLARGPLMYVKVQDLDENLAEFTNTGFWKTIGSINYEKAASADPQARQAFMIFQQFSQKLLTPENKKFVADFLGEEFAVAVYPAAVDHLVTGNIPAALQQAVFVTKLNPRLRIQEAVAGISSRFMTDTRITTAEYKGREIHSVNSGRGMQFGYVRFGDYLVMGVTDRAARSAVDRMENGEAALSRDAKFQNIQARTLPDADSVAYVDLEVLVSYMEAMATGIAGQAAAGMEETDAAMVRRQYKEVVDQWSGFQSLAYSGRFGVPLSFGKLDVHFVLDEMDGEIRPFYQCSPGGNNSLKIIPGNVLAYQWSGCILFDHYWRIYQEELAKMPPGPGQQPGAVQVEEIIAGIEQNIGLDIEEDILAAFGDEIGGFLLDIDSSGMFPLPSTAFFIEVADRSKTEQLIGTLLNNYAFFRPNAESYGNSTMEYVQFPFLKNLEPGYALVGNYLVLATNRNVLRGAIDTFEGRAPSLSADADLRKVSPDLFKTGNMSAVYIRVGRIAQKMEGVLKWADQWISVQEDKQMAFKAGTEQRLKDIEKEITGQRESLRISREELSSLEERFAGDAAVDEEELQTEIARLEKRLADLQAIPSPEDSTVQEIADLRMALSRRRQELGDQQQAQKEIRGLKEEITVVEQNLESSLQMQGELTKIVEGYENQVLAPQARRALTEEVMGPLLKAFQFIGVSVGWSVVEDQALQSYFYTTLE